EPVEILKSHTDRPLVKRPGRAVEIGGGVMVLAKPRGGITVLLQDFADRGAILTDDGIIAWEAGGHLTDDAVTDRVMVAAGDQGRTRRGAKRGGVELRVTQACLRDPIHGWGRDHATKGAVHAVTLVIRHDEKDVGRTF